MANSHSSAFSNFCELAEVLATNFKANATLADKPPSQVIVVLGASASEIPPLPSWTQELKHKILDQVGRIFQDERIFLEEICRVFGSELGHYLWNREEMRNAILENLKVEQISNVACQMLGHADFMVRKLISDEYKVLGDTDEGPPPHLTYELLAHLVMHGFINHIVTMNFDEMLDTALENELGSRGFKRIITGHEPLEAGEPRTPRLLKVHGTASSPESLRFTYTEVSVLTSAQAKHLNTMLESASNSDCECLNLVSFGYSWQDPDLAHWVFAHLKRFKAIFIVRREKGIPKIFSKQISSLPRTEQERFKVLSADEFCGGQGKAVSSNLFWWCLVEKVWSLLGGEPLIPFARHLLLGNLLAPSQGRSAYTALARRVRLEILLHLVKSKGMINTFGAPDSPRIRAYFSRLRSVHQDKVTVENFLSTLNLSEFMQRSPEPEARDTFFSTADSLDQLVEKVSRTFVAEASLPIRRPVLENGMLTVQEVKTSDFVREQTREIATAPEIEISKEVNIRLHWIFSNPVPILTFPQFATSIRDALSPSWTHLLAIVESKRWLAYPWTRDLLNHAGKRKILLILPSLEGLDGWRVGHSLRRSMEAAEIAVEDTLFELEIPWWKHNRHMFLPIRMEDDNPTMGKGVFFLREHKSPAISPVLLKDSRDHAKLLATFMFYAQRSTSRDESGLGQELMQVVERLLETDGIDSDMVELVKKAYTSLARHSGVQ